MRHEHRDAPDAVIAALEDGATRATTRFEGGGTMVWRRWGAGPPLVLLHGASGSWTHWIRNIPALAARHAVLAPDMPGFGDSDTLPEPHTAERLAAAVAAGLETLLPPPAPRDLVGFSFGSIIAGVAAAGLGRRVGRLVLIGPGGMAHRSDVGGLVLARVEPGMSEAQVREVHRENLRRLMLGDPAAADDLAVHLQVDNVGRARFKSGTIPTRTCCCGRCRGSRRGWRPSSASAMRSWVATSTSAVRRSPARSPASTSGSSRAPATG